MKRKLWLMAFAGASVTTWALAEPPAPAKSDAKGDTGVAAMIGDKPITTAELDAKILKQNMKLAQQLYDARKAALDDAILDKALGEEAKAANTSVDQLLKKKVSEKVTPPTDPEVAAYYNANQAKMQGKSLEEMTPQIKSFLSTQRESEAKVKILAEIKAKANVKVMLEVPRVEVAIAPNAASNGPKDAKVTIVEFSDFQ
ncbi:MAG: hypothetical protein HY287_09785 [Planctomycetes bacterium]|nr:hypothetical protein [Planctomycetota bacterium]MBI3834604.1 hypothetical protein [Planctomycetota bacterium]